MTRLVFQSQGTSTRWRRYPHCSWNPARQTEDRTCPTRQPDNSEKSENLFIFLSVAIKQDTWRSLICLLSCRISEARCRGGRPFCLPFASGGLPHSGVPTTAKSSSPPPVLRVLSLILTRMNRFLLYSLSSLYSFSHFWVFARIRFLYTFVKIYTDGKVSFCKIHLPVVLSGCLEQLVLINATLKFYKPLKVCKSWDKARSFSQV